MKLHHCLTVALIAPALFFSGCTRGCKKDAGAPTPESQSASATAQTLRIETLKEGSGDKAATPGNVVSVHYTGWLASNNQKFDSSLDRNQPFMFRLGEGRVIAGWEQGVQGMKVGEKRKLTIPPELGYGKQGAGNAIPPDSTLVFEVELLEIKE